MLTPETQDGRPYGAKIAECYALCDASDDPLVRAVYRAMAAEFEARAAPKILFASARQANLHGIALAGAQHALPQPRFVPQAK
jgi:hypothetical protein